MQVGQPYLNDISPKSIELDYSSIENIEDLSALLNILDDEAVDSNTKKKRKETFAKYKQRLSSQQATSTKSALEVFDEIFMIKQLNQKLSRKKTNTTNPQEFMDDLTMSFQQFLKDLDFSSEIPGLQTIPPPSPTNEREFLQAHLIPSNIKYPVQQQDKKTPQFLKKLRTKNSVYPNFKHPEVYSVTENQNVREIIFEAQCALTELQTLCLQIEKKNTKIRTFSLEYQEVFTLEYFMNSGWEKYIEVKGLQRIKPKCNFAKRTIDYSKIKLAFKNYTNILNFYKGRKAYNFEKNEELTLYWEFRRQVWDIERNLKLISEDLYIEGIKFEFPDFYHYYLHILRSPVLKVRGQEQIQQMMNLNQRIIKLQQQKQPLTCSEIGQAVKRRIRMQLKTFS